MVSPEQNYEEVRDRVQTIIELPREIGAFYDNLGKQIHEPRRAIIRAIMIQVARKLQSTEKIPLTLGEVENAITNQK